MIRTLTFVFLLLTQASCSSPPAAGTDAAVDDAGADDAALGVDGGTAPITVGTAARPARLVLPPAHDGVTPLPLMILLHGYGASGIIEDTYLHTAAIARLRGFYLVVPDGTMDAGGRRFWNAQPGCCDFGHTNVDDVAYLTGIIDQAEAVLPIDRTRIYFFGHSNGAFMSYRMACEIGDRIAGIGILAGGDFVSPTACVPPRPVSVFHIHGTADDTVTYETALTIDPVHAGAVESTQRWATIAGCDLGMATTEGPFEFDAAVPGPETTATNYVAGCSGALVTLLTMAGSGHIPTLPQSSTERAVDWLLARSAPAP